MRKSRALRRASKEQLKQQIERGWWYFSILYYVGFCMLAFGIWLLITRMILIGALFLFLGVMIAVVTQLYKIRYEIKELGEIK